LRAGGWFLIAIFGLVGWGSYAEDRASTKANEFCDSISSSQPFAELAELAKNAGETQLRVINDQSLVVGFAGIPPFSRHLCEIRLNESGDVTKRYLLID
jgi:hypothetical protein